MDLSGRGIPDLEVNRQVKQFQEEYEEWIDWVLGRREKEYG